MYSDTNGWENIVDQNLQVVCACCVPARQDPPVKVCNTLSILIVFQ